MLKNPLQLRLEKLGPWQQITFMVCLCERMYPNYGLFCEHTKFAEHRIYRNILDSIWEMLTVKTAKINFERQLEKLEDLFPYDADEFDFYGVYPAIDACRSLSLLLHGILDRDYLFDSMILVSAQSVDTVIQLEQFKTKLVISDDNQKENIAVCEEWDLQWKIFRALKQASERDIDLIKDLRDEIRDQGISNLGMAM